MCRRLPFGKGFEEVMTHEDIRIAIVSEKKYQVMMGTIVKTTDDLCRAIEEDYPPDATGLRIDDTMDIVLDIILEHMEDKARLWNTNCLLYTSPSPRDRQKSRMPSSA